jgi:hypothetical protein
MVHLVDEGSEFDAPLETVWAYLTAPGIHRVAHPKTRNFEVTELAENYYRLAMDQMMGSQWVRTVGRGAVYPPLGSVSETLEGPLAGSKYFLFYTPRGPKTGVTIVGEFVGRGMTDRDLETMVRGQFEEFFNEDQVGLRAFRATASRGSAGPG